MNLASKTWAGILLGFTLYAAPVHAARYGLFVGVNTYACDGISSLAYCTADAGAMRTNLVTHGGGWTLANSTLLFDSAGTKTAIRAALTNYAAKAVAGDVVVYFQSSHGGNDDTTRADVYLCTYNADYTEDELAADLSKFKAGVKVIVIVDACHSGGLFYETLSPAEKAVVRQAARAWNLAERVTARMEDLRTARLAADSGTAPRLIAPEEIGWMTACAYDESSYEDDEIGHGWFTYRLLQGLAYGDSSGDGWASFQELFDFAYLRIPYLDQEPQDFNSSILGTLAGSAGATPAGDAWDYADNIIAGATDLAPAATLQLHGPHALRKDLDESDFFAIPVRKNVCYTFRSANLSAGGDVDADLYAFSDAAGAQLIRYATDINYPDNLNFEMVYKASADGIVFLRVQPYWAGNTELSYALEHASAGAADSMGLASGVPRSIAFIDEDDSQDFVLAVPPGQTNLTITLRGGTGDADLYVARGYFPWEQWDDSSGNSGNDETIVVANPDPGEWFIQCYGYNPSSSMTLLATLGPGAATIGTISNAATSSSLDVDLTNGARIAIYSATNVLANGHWNWVLASNAATVVQGKVTLNIGSNLPSQVISVGRPLDF